MINKRLYSPSYVKKLIDKYDFRFSKSLGQNFLIDGNIVRKIVQGANITKEDYVLEIGPGIGTLTEELALHAKKVVSVELDEKLLELLDETLESYDNVEIIHGDILKTDVKKIVDEKLNGGPIKIVANLPYYVTTPIIGMLLENSFNIDSITVMIQKEVADRMLALHGSKTYGSLSVFIRFYSNPQIIVKVPKTVFMPQPKIDSTVIKLDIKKDLPDVDRDQLFKVVKAAFSKRRKTLLNALSSYGFENLDKDTIKNTLEEIQISPEIRAENLSIEEFINISKILPPLNI
ncbi:MAG TPA: 16S rRNA (adenine(1518)-N(6)/adenine(1519)-N(6))-dimethyltransferase RsmA [Tissierellaceae bacterium]|nr:16S rRNA (adenine(1518)-N(6)/adenine(1519)-N(6))-dimethyltransferase RsmA [Tissierellaceae bacterium]